MRQDQERAVELKFELERRKRTETIVLGPESKGFPTVLALAETADTGRSPNKMKRFFPKPTDHAGISYYERQL